jgi:hypothetical protein
MKPAEIESPIGLDHPATWDEVLCAMSSSPQNGSDLVDACDNFSELDSDFSDSASHAREDVMWLTLATEMLDSTIN